MVLPLSSVDVNRSQQPVIKSRKSTMRMNGNHKHNIQHHNGPGTTTQSHRRSSLDVVVLCFVVAVCIVAIISFMGSSLMMHHMETNKSGGITITNSAIQNSLRKMKQARPTTIEVDDLEHEGLFRKLIKSCLPYDTKTHTPIKNTKCGTYIYEFLDYNTTTTTTSAKPKKLKKLQRIAILAPPGDLSGSLINRVEQIVQEYNQFISSKTTSSSSSSSKNGGEEYIPMELVVTSHIPPYGYGKTHGYTKILRLIPEPLLLEVTDAITAILRPGESHQIVTLIDVQQVLRQVLRYHCRLNHLSAHTAILSIKFMDLFADPIGITQQIRTFLFPATVLAELSSQQQQQQQQLRRNNEKKNVAGVAGEEPVTDDDQSEAAGEGMALEEEKSIDDDQSSLMDAELAYGSQILTSIQQQYVDHGRTNVTVGSTLLDILDKTLLNEFYVTKDMSKWPCLSFWDTTTGTTTTTTTMNDGPSQKKNDKITETMSDIVQRLAKKLSPNCNDPYNNCFVRRDQCEFVGDAACDDTSTGSTTEQR